MAQDEKPPSFEAFDAELRRLKGAREPEGGGKEADGPRAKWGVGLQVGIELVAGVAGGTLAGFFLDRWLGTAPLLLILFFTFFYTAVVFNPKETADNLRKYGGFLPGIRPGEKTAEYIDYVLTRITVVGAIYLAAVCVLPEALISYAAVPFYFGGTSLLIAVSVTMDTVAQIQSHLLAHQYEGLIKKAKLKGATSRSGRR